MIKTLTKGLALGFLLITAVSCGSDDEGPDTEAPTVTIQTPAAGQDFAKGAAIPLKATFKDNKALSKCTVSLTFNAAPVSGNALKGISDPYAPEDAIITLSGTEDPKELTNIFATKIDALCKSGDYTLSFVVEDATGNKSKAKTLDIIIR